MMRTISLVIATKALLAPAPTCAAPRRLTEDEHQRFLQERESIEEQYHSWMQSDAGLYAQENSLVPDAVKVNDPNTPFMPVVSSSNNSKPVTNKERQLLRFYLSQLGIEQARKENPEANFTINTPFALMTDEEFAKYVGDNNVAMPEESQSNTMQAEEMSMPAWYSFKSMRQADAKSGSKDWTESGCVSPPRQQAQCGSCWAFSAISVLETAHCLKTGKLQTFSEQHLVSCDNTNHGCGGGYGTSALNFVKRNGGICSADSYPYASGKSRQNGQCTSSKCQKVNLAIQKLVQPQPTEQGFIQALSKMPMIVAVSASSSVWKQYRGGVVTSCPAGPLNHAVTAVGYGTSGQSTYYKIKNSWGPQWGDHGYMMLSRQGSACGILNRAAVYPEV